MSNQRDLTLTVYPPDREPEQWQVRAAVFGDWAAHRAHPEESRVKPWCVTHVPSGAIAFVAKQQGVAVEAARRLQLMELPTVKVLSNDTSRPNIEPLPMEWIEQAAKQLAGMRLWASAGPHDVPIDYLPEYIIAVRKTN